MRQRNGAGWPYRLYWSDDAAYGALAGGRRPPLVAASDATGNPCSAAFADIIGRLLVPGELRVSVVSAFIGAPVLIFLVRRKSNGGGL